MARQRSREWLGVWLVLAAVVFAVLLVWVIVAESTLALILLFVGAGVLIVLGSSMAIQHRRSAPAPLPPAPDDGVYRVLVVVDDGATTPAFRDELVSSTSGRPAKFFVVAPALSSTLDRWTGDQEAYDTASSQLEATLQALDALGVDASGRIGAHDPLQATIDGLREFPADAIVVATHESGSANRLEDGFVESVRGLTTASVTHVVVDAGG